MTYLVGDGVDRDTVGGGEGGVCRCLAHPLILPQRADTAGGDRPRAAAPAAYPSSTALASDAAAGQDGPDRRRRRTQEYR
jgi:hypothetical protein